MSLFHDGTHCAVTLRGQFLILLVVFACFTTIASYCFLPCRQTCFLPVDIVIVVSETNRILPEVEVPSPRGTDVEM